MASRATGTTKKAAGTRTTPRKTVVDIDFDADRGSPGRKRFKFRLGGRDWTAQKPNIIVLGEIEQKAEETQNYLAAGIGELLEFIAPAQRADFMETLKNEPGFDVDRLIHVRDELRKLVFGDLPTEASSD